MTDRLPSVALRAATFLRRGVTPVTLMAIAVSLFGCLSIYSATFHLERPLEFVGRQAVWLILAVPTLFAVAALDPSRIRRAFPWAAALAYLALLLVLRFGISVNGMRGWFAWAGVFVQPSELAKPLFVLSLASLLGWAGRRGLGAMKTYLLALAVLAVWTAPIALQPDFGTCLVYGLTFLAVYGCMGGRWPYLAVTAGIGAGTGALLVWKIPYVAARLAGFWQPQACAETSGWHILQFQRTLASGGIFGHWWGKAVWAPSYLPLGYSDSIFASIGESIGFVGLLPFVAAILLWVYYGYRRVKLCADLGSAATILGMVSFLGMQAFIHLSVNLGLMPATGITLPLISYGGSSLMSTVLAIGIVEAMSRARSSCHSPVGALR